MTNPSTIRVIREVLKADAGVTVETRKDILKRLHNPDGAVLATTADVLRALNVSQTTFWRIRAKYGLRPKYSTATSSRWDLAEIRRKLRNQMQEAVHV